MMSSSKKKVRSDFRIAVFERDRYKCRACADVGELDAHHITDRNIMPNGGYVIENGISLCAECHKMAELYHSTGFAPIGYMPEDLYVLIGSSLEKAEAASCRLSVVK